ncbi:MAG TPA: tyrosine-type recombinase/integrase [Pyrinomonadaceae bacterium]|nr:tyrosine-type recombinase/integrase [Pyrinomonadaceae bacterium]
MELKSLKQDALSDEHVFSYARTGLKLTTFRHAWEGACAAAKISALRFHDLRHTFATRLQARGVHEMDIMSLLGHTTLQMTEIGRSSVRTRWLEVRRLLDNCQYHLR